jgi:hypothetical protein
MLVLLKPYHVAPTVYRYYFQEQCKHFLEIKGEKQLNKKVIGVGEK